MIGSEGLSTTGSMASGSGTRGAGGQEGRGIKVRRRPRQSTDGTTRRGILKKSRGRETERRSEKTCLLNQEEKKYQFSIQGSE